MCADGRSVHQGSHERDAMKHSKTELPWQLVVFGAAAVVWTLTLYWTVAR